MTSMPAPTAENAAVPTMAELIRTMAADPELAEARRRNLALRSGGSVPRSG